MKRGQYYRNIWRSALIYLSIGGAIWLGSPHPAHSNESARYPEAISQLPTLRDDATRLDDSALEARLISGMESLFDHWDGTRWGLGAPQTEVPQRGKVNCGTFVGRTLVDAGFNMNARKFQRQPAELAIKSLVPKRLIRRFRYASMNKFLAGVREMGAGLYIVGLDFHVGYLLVRASGEVRFIHASYVTKTVITEVAEDSIPLQTSTYRVIGKLFSARLLKKWRAHQRVKVLGNW